MSNVKNDLTNYAEKADEAATGSVLFSGNSEVKPEVPDVFVQTKEDINPFSIDKPIESLILYGIDTEENREYDLGKDISLGEGVIIKNWKNVHNLSARLIECDEDSVLLECLVSKEENIYEEREFKRSLFDSFSLQVGKLFKLCFYERGSQVMMEIKDNPDLILESDFPKTQFAEKFSNLTLKRRN